MVNLKRYEEIALQEALKSPLSKKHSAILVHRGKVIATGVNGYRRSTICSTTKYCVLRAYKIHNPC